MKKQTRDQKLKDCYDAFKAVRENRPVKRQGTKDGSIATHPVVPIPALSEAIVLKDCMKWLRKRGILANRNNVGSGQMGNSGYYSYGIKNAGDIICLFPDGKHFEIEVKRGLGGRLSVGQQKRMAKVRENNGIYLIVHGTEELKHYLTDLPDFT